MTHTKTPLPLIMVAPNGARRDTKMHAALPILDDDIVQTAQECFDAGADGIHIHIRDDDALHVLDATHYQSVLNRLKTATPNLYLQVTSESAGRYGAIAQQEMMRTLKPKHVSVAVREMVRSPEDWPDATQFYQWAEDEGLEIQHIVYSTDELSVFLEACQTGRIAGTHHLLQLVLGTYDGKTQSRPEDIQAFVSLMNDSGLSLDWGLCAFGKEETQCLIEAVRLGGKARVGFENSLWHSDGSLAKNNAERVREVKASIDALTSISYRL